MTAKLRAVYRITSTAAEIEARARAIAVEQSVEMPISAITDAHVLGHVVGIVEGIVDRGGGLFDATIALDASTVGSEAGQLLNILFGNSSIHQDVTLHSFEVPTDLAASFGGPRHGIAGLRARVGAKGQAIKGRAMTCSALKPLGLSASALGELAHRLALGGLDTIKDDHGLADQRSAPFADRVASVAARIADATRITGKATRYLPNVSGNLDTLRAQVAVARSHGLDTLLIAPLIVGLPSFATIVRENKDMAFVAHPAMAGAARIAPPALLGQLFRMLGADGVIFPNVGGRFGYSTETCREIAATALRPWPGIKPSLPVPAGGMKLERVPEILTFYGPQCMLLIGGDLLAAGTAMTSQAAAFQTAVERFAYPS